MKAVIKAEMVPFHTEKIQSWKDETGDIKIGMRQTANTFGLAWAGQYVKLTKGYLYKDSIGITMIETPGGPQPVLGLSLDMLPTWLLSIEPAKVSASIRDKLILYQKECARVLKDYWLGQRPGPSVAIAQPMEAMAKPALVPQLTEDSLDNRIKHLELIDKAYTFWAKSGGLTEKRTARLNWLAGALVFQSGEANSTALQAG